LLALLGAHHFLHVSRIRVKVKLFVHTFNSLQYISDISVHKTKVSSLAVTYQLLLLAGHYALRYVIIGVQVLLILGNNK